jgi:hypothetical protein
VRNVLRTNAKQEQIMQPTTSQTVPAPSSVPSQAADRQPSAPGQAPAPIDAEMLRQISGGVGAAGPTGSW